MNGFDPEEAKQYITSNLSPSALRFDKSQIEGMVEAFLLYDLHFMRLTGVLDAEDNQGDCDYDDDEAFEYIFDAYLSDHAASEETSMKVASVLDRYMELLYEYMKLHGLVEE